MRLPTLVVGTVASLALALSAAAPGLAEQTPAPAASGSTAGELPPADPTAPVQTTEATTDAAPTDVTPTDAAPTDAAPTDVTPTDAATPTEETAPVDEASATPTPQIGGNGAYSYPFTLVAGEDGSATVAIEVAGTGVALSYTVDEQGKVTDAVIATGDATLIKVTPHTVQLVLATGERVTIKIHGDSVRVKVKPRKGGPLRPGIATPEEAEGDEAAAAPAVESEDADEDAAADKGAKGKERAAQAKKSGKGKSQGKGKGKGKSKSGKH